MENSSHDGVNLHKFIRKIRLNSHHLMNIFFHRQYRLRSYTISVKLLSKDKGNRPGRAALGAPPYPRVQPYRPAGDIRKKPHHHTHFVFLAPMKRGTAFIPAMQMPACRRF
ncbi:hypothetical protein M0657_011947 [Pyricularia oryzae]|uniref:Uncharacterized protein n=2 Tax=Pyricularia oryzae TaxID=318829 RepID=A0A4P7N7C3_PYROR|nr:hypothetical protein OOU_Y34scaffold00040g3 [Pyricularia oryzae Y34]KAI7909185.1 hypothetical protein M9X92_011779 [Pyricularia oryzae]KAI7909194.1 hypothetical protein M0657_011947 [Pyricularia oryzae]QBZ57532.1 hypothetical protein PoMZ_02459 [Pyricularia oryzae]